MQWIVKASESGEKLVTFLKNKTGSQFSARQIKSAIEAGRCRINQRVEHFASVSVVEGDKVAFEMESLEASGKKNFEFSPNDILYENHALLIYNKPEGVASDGPEIGEAIRQYGHGWELLHRLDKDTTGLLMFTKTPTFREKMVQSFKTHAVEKVYLALVDGVPSQKSGLIDNYLAKKHQYEGQAIWGSVSTPHEGHHAITAWQLEKKGAQASLIRCFPKTGRTHQIRVHLSEMGHPILGDKQYGRNIRCNYYAKRCLLHAYELTFTHPDTQQVLYFQSPIPPDFMEAAQTLMGGLS